MSRVPATLAGAKNRLTAIGALVTASEWERAAIVAAFVHFPGQGSRTDTSSNLTKLSAEQFASLGIVGLRSANTVKRYVTAWMDHSGYERPEPGMDIPADLPEWGDVVPVTETRQDRAKWSAPAVAEALENPEFAAKVARQMTPKARVETQSAVHAATRESMDTISDTEKANRKRDRAAFDKAARSIMWDNADGYIGMARGYLVKAVEYVRMDGWPDKDRDDLVAELDRVLSLCRMIRADLTGESGTNWDAELAAMIGGAS